MRKGPSAVNVSSSLGRQLLRLPGKRTDFSFLRDLAVGDVCRATPSPSFNQTLKASGASWVTQTVKNLPAMQETWVQSLGCEDPLEKGMATHSRIVAWRILWTEEPGRLQSVES